MFLIVGAYSSGRKISMVYFPETSAFEELRELCASAAESAGLRQSRCQKWGQHQWRTISQRGRCTKWIKNPMFSWKLIFRFAPEPQSTHPYLDLLYSFHDTCHRYEKSFCKIYFGKLKTSNQSNLWPSNIFWRGTRNLVYPRFLYLMKFFRMYKVLTF